MARTMLEARREGKLLLLCENGLRHMLRVGGDFAGNDTKEGLKKELYRQFWEQEQRENGENLGHYLQPQTCSSPPPLPSAGAENNTCVVKDVKAGRRRKASRDVASLDRVQGDHHVLDVSSLPVSYSTRSAERKSKIEAAEKRRLAASEKRKFLAAKKKQKLANYYASGSRRAATRSTSSLQLPVRSSSNRGPQ